MYENKLFVPTQYNNNTKLEIPKSQLIKYKILKPDNTNQKYINI